MFKLALAFASVFALLAFAAPATASVITVDLSHFPDGSVVPDNAIIADQYRDIGILFGARTQGGDPLSLFIGNTRSGRRFLFNTPDVFGAVQQFRFVEPGTSVVASATFFSTSPDFDSIDAERVRLVGISSTGEILKSLIVNSSPGNLRPVISITADEGKPFALVEVRTFGNPGIGFLFNNQEALKFQLAPDPSQLQPVPGPSSMVLLGVGVIGLAWRARHRGWAEQKN